MVYAYLDESLRPVRHRPRPWAHHGIDALSAASRSTSNPYRLRDLHQDDPWDRMAPRLTPGEWLSLGVLAVAALCLLGIGAGLLIDLVS